MPLTPEDFEDREFLITLRGYDRDEVQSFLEEAARDYRAALKAVEQTKHANPANPLEALGQDVVGILAAAQEVADKMLAEAKKRKAGADKEAATAHERASQEVASLKESTAAAARQVKEEAERFASNLKASTEKAAHQVKEEAERFASTLKASATADAAKVRQEADRYSIEVRARADTAVQERERSTRENIETLTKMEQDLRGRLADLQRKLSETLAPAGLFPTVTPAPAEAEAPGDATVVLQAASTDALGDEETLASVGSVAADQLRIETEAPSGSTSDAAPAANEPQKSDRLDDRPDGEGSDRLDDRADGQEAVRETRSGERAASFTRVSPRVPRETASPFGLFRRKVTPAADQGKTEAEADEAKTRGSKTRGSKTGEAPSDPVPRS